MPNVFVAASFIALIFSTSAGAQDVESINGKWSGSGHHTAAGLANYAITMTISGNGGTIDYPDRRCSGMVARIGVGGSSGTFREHITRGIDNCADGGTITVHAHDDQLDWAWNGASAGDSAVAVLVRSP